ncbi:recombination mediator RecR [Candidatus Margulisiibacteriota bacterium]
MTYAEPFGRLIDEFKKMPGVGPKSAQRLAFYILQISEGEVKDLVSSIGEAKKQVKYCSKCFNLTVSDPCNICGDESRNRSKVCIVSDPKDLIAIEKTREYKGLYHVLGGVISPLDGIGPENLRVKEMLRRLEGVNEIIFALNPTVEGEATIMYLTKLLKPLNLKLTRIAYGLPVGSDMDYADEVTLTKAFEGRKEI